MDVDWEDGQTISVTIVQTPVTVEPQPNSQATGAPTITGTPQVGEILRARMSGIADADGLTNAIFTYQWVSGGSKIERVTGSRYTPDEGDVGKTIQVTVTFTDDAENEETLTSEPTAEVVAKPSEVTIIGEARVGETLTANVDGITDEDGVETATFHYTWSNWYYFWGRMFAYQYSSDPNYTLTESDLGTFFVVTVTFKDDEGNEEERTSSPSAWVKPANNPATGLPIISGEPQVGERLTADVSGISDDDGIEDTTFSYQWVSNDGVTDEDIHGATASTYTLSVDQVAQTIKVRVSFTDARQSREVRNSAATEAVAATIPSEPLILTVTKGDQIQELDVSWKMPSSDGGSAITGYKVQWKEAAGSWSASADVSETTVTGTTHTITKLTGGVEYYVRVLATNGVGDGPASSEVPGTPVGGVSQQNAEPENSAPTGLPTITGMARVDETLTADTTGINDADGLDNVSFSYQWLADDTDIPDATGSTYTLAEGDEGKTIKVKVTFDDAAGNGETLTSAATAAVAAAPAATPLTASHEDAPASHDGQDSFTFKLRFSEEVELSYLTLRDHAFTVTGGTVDKAQRLTPGSNTGWTITATPDADADVTLALPATTDCDASGAVCTAGGKKLSAALTLTVPGPEPPPQQNGPATGAPTISGTARVDETLTASTAGIDDEDGLDNASFSYQWLADDADIAGATGATYALLASDQGKTVKVRVSFEDDAGNEETLTSLATAAVAAAPPPLTARLEGKPSSHDGQTAFTFELHFSEEFGISYLTLRDQAFSVTNGTVTKAKRLTQGSNLGWRITVTPVSGAGVTVVLPETTDCNASGAVCTGNGRMLSNRNEFTVSGG